MSMHMERMRFAVALTCIAVLSGTAKLAAQKMDKGGPDAGKQIYLTRCASCHGTTGNGGEFAPGITSRVSLRTDEELVQVLHSGLSSSGMPPFPDIVDTDRKQLIAYLRALSSASGVQLTRVSVDLEGGATLSGSALNRAGMGHDGNELQLLGEDKRLHLLRMSKNGRWREVTSQEDWPGYNGDSVGYRYSKMTQITPDNVKQLAPVWMSQVPNTRELQCTPVVVGGVMYVTSANEVYALDAGSGRSIWHYQRPRTVGVGGVGATGANRGVAVDGDKVFLATDNAHLLALNRHTGAILWDTEMIDWHQNYNGTAAPLIVDHMVVAGIAGGDDGARGFVAAYDEGTGKQLWLTWTVPAPGEAGSETWTPESLKHPSGATWMTGYFDRETNAIIWPVGNPGPDLIGDDRPGDNLFTDSVIALDPKTGQRRWYFQFTPHDVHDFDAMAPSALIDTEWQGKPRKLLVQANRNGFMYVLDRTNGKFLYGAPFSKMITWAKGLTSEGRPIVVPDMEATHEGKLVCPWLNGASNWPSTSWNPMTGLYYVQTDDKCGIYTRTDMPFQLGHGYMAGSFSGDPADPGRRILRAIDINTGKAVWEIPQSGDGTTWGGVLSTASGIVFFSADDGAFSAADARTGRMLYRFATNQNPHASPMTYSFDHRQFVAVASGSDILAFSLPE